MHEKRFISSDFSGTVDCTNTSPFEHLLKKERAEIVEQFLNQLTPQYFEVLTASIGSHPKRLTLRELAESWGVTSQNLHAMKYRAMRCFRAKLTAGGYNADALLS